MTKLILMFAMVVLTCDDVGIGGGHIEGDLEVFGDVGYEAGRHTLFHHHHHRGAHKRWVTQEGAGLPRHFCARHTPKKLKNSSENLLWACVCRYHDELDRKRL